MSQPDPNLLAWLPSVATLSDADAATAANVPTYTPRTSWVTFATLCSAPVWGFAKAAGFRAALMAASSNPSAVAVLALLDGVGFNPADPQAAAESAGMVALANGTITTADATIALNTVSYAAGGSGTYVVADVTAARAYLADQAARAKITAALASVLNDWLHQQATAPTAAAVGQQVAAAMAAAGVA